MKIYSFLKIEVQLSYNVISVSGVQENMFILIRK